MKQTTNPLIAKNFNLVNSELYGTLFIYLTLQRPFFFSKAHPRNL